MGYYNPLVQSTGAGATAYGNASGANGIPGLQQATNEFKNSGQYGVYGVGLGEGLQALDRAHAAAGNLSSGNADTDAIKYAQDQASKAYGSYTAGLQPYLGANASAVGGAAGVATGQGGALNNSYMNQGNAANANYTGQGASDAAATMNNYNVGSNQLGALMGIGNLASGGIGGGLTGGLGGLFSSFGGTPTGPTNPGSMGGIRYPQF